MFTATLHLLMHIYLCMHVVAQEKKFPRHLRLFFVAFFWLICELPLLFSQTLDQRGS